MLKLQTVEIITRWLVRYRVPLTFLILVALILEDIFSGRQPHDIHRFQDWVGVVGFCLALTGLLLRSWAAGIISKTKALATSGRYAICRNPLYLGSLLLALGVCIIMGCWKNIVAILLLAVVIYRPKIRQEEIHLQTIFSEQWQRYAEKTPALIPTRISADIRSSWSKIQWLNNKEYKAFLTGLTSLAVLEVWHELMR